MSTKPRVQDNLSILKKDTAKMMSDLDTIAESLKESGREESEKVVQELGARYEAQMTHIRERLKELNDAAREKATAVDKNLHEKPYIYLACAAGMGFILGKLSSRKSS